MINMHVLVTLDSLAYLPLPPKIQPLLLFLRGSCQDNSTQRLFKVLWLCYAVILAKYGMDEKRDTRPLESNSLKDHDIKEEDAFEDPRLDKLWNKVCVCVHNSENAEVLLYVRCFDLMLALFVV